MINKLLSGRFIFTCVVAILLYHGTMTGKFPPEKVIDIIKDVVIFYFVVKQAINQGGSK